MEIFLWGASDVTAFFLGMLFCRAIINGVETGAIARATVIAWADSGGFAAVHDTGGTPESITDDLLKYLHRHGYAIVRVSAPR